MKINLNNGEVESRIIGLVHSLYVSSAFSSDGNYLAVADTKNKVIYLYDIENDSLTTLSLPSLNFPFATFPRGDFLIFEGDDLYVVGVDDSGEMKVVRAEKIE